MKKIIIAFWSFLLLTNSIHAQYAASEKADKQAPFVLGIVEKIQSVELNETRTLNIYLPQGYSPDSSKTYPVVYLLDGSANEDFVHVVGVVQFLTMIEAMPKSIVVGIANIDRRRDFTFPTTIEKDKKSYPTTGSSAKFMVFIEKELQPFIHRKFKTSDTKTIIGQSLGGLFAAEVLLKRSALFSNYIIISPSLWWDNESLLAATPGMLEKQTGKGIHVYISVGSEGKQMEDDANRFAEILQAGKHSDWHINFLPLPDETHLTILHNSVYKGFEILYPKNSNQKR